MKSLFLALMFFWLSPLWWGFAFAQDVLVIDDPSLCRLVVRENFDHHLMWATDYVLEIQKLDHNELVKVSYLLLDASGTPQSPTQGLEIRGNAFIAGWDPGRQYFFRIEVESDPQYLPFPHYRTVLLVLAGEKKVYAVFLRENDRRITSLVLQGGPFTDFTVPELGEVRFQDGSLRVESFGRPVEVGLWMNGTYLHDEVAGYARPEFAANPKYYSIPRGLFMLSFARYGKMGVLIGEKHDQGVVAVVLSGSKVLEREEVPGLCSLQSFRGPQVLVESFGGPVEVTHFSLDNTCYQWEVGGWAQPGFRENPQVLPLKHYTPGFLLLSRYDRVGLFFYNENDGVVGMLPVRGASLFPPRVQDFSFALLREIALKEDTNVLLSPLSLSVALAVLLGGACEETERVLKTLLGFPEYSATEVSKMWAELLRNTRIAGADSSVTLSVACALWGQEGIAFQEAFLEEAGNLFDAHLETLNFREPGALERINAWVRERTEGHVEQLLEKLHPEDVLVLTSAVFLKALWTQAFDPKRTQDAPFVLPSGEKKNWPMMEGTGDFPYFENELLQMVALPYGRDRRIRMCFLLPREGIPLGDLLGVLSAKTWGTWRSALESRRGLVRIPRFTVRYGGELKDVLSALGMGILFSPSASFCRLANSQVFVSSVRHGTCIEVDEEGTEASGATAVVVSKNSGTPFSFVADRPFCFLLEDTVTEALLFVGVLVDPQEAPGKDFPLRERGI